MVQVMSNAKLLKVLNSSSVVISLVSFVLAVLVSGLIMFLCGYDPFYAYSIIFEGSFGSLKAFSNTLIQATPLILTGLAFMIAKKATMINLGVEGQLYCGALVSAIVGMTPLGLPGFLHFIVTLVAGILAGAVAGEFIGFLKVKFGSNEVITTTMTNFIIINFCDYLVNYPLKSEGAVAQTNLMLPETLLPKIIPGYQITYAIVIAIIAAFIIKFILDKTRFGYEIKVVGLNMIAGETAGIHVKKIMMLGMSLSGCLAGLAGATHVMSVGKRFISGFSPGYGFSGISVAALASDSPLGILLAGVIFGALKTGSMYLNMSSKIPTEFVSVIQALVVIFVSAPLLIKAIIGLNRKSKGGK
ncbi:MAG: ABC transporter permease [Anaerorhabdus sp.]|uniref:ABC transporter permease n=1 Tax=Anaerorhabdus sp. TaxID=1872524 RepID=UPI003A8A5FC7